ncbi:M15 family metallopeptidase [Solibacillus silvestris]|uniref:M15 family metallopeptidase n=1 Tax=Solibacillus silvestris TaxID=76853 RepID=UPI003F80AC40
MLEKYSIPIYAKAATSFIPVVKENEEPLVEIRPIAHKLFVEPRYFIEGIPNSLQKIYLRQQAALNLLKALEHLPGNLSFILYDGFRPIQVQTFLYNEIKRKIEGKYPQWSPQQIELETLKYVAFPSMEERYHAPHLTGGAIDLTLGDHLGNPLNLGTAFDETEKKSATSYFENHPSEDEEAYINRRILFHCMTNAGFHNYEEEWWHYDFGNKTWASKEQTDYAIYGPIAAVIQQHLLKEYRFI